MKKKPQIQSGSVFGTILGIALGILWIFPFYWAMNTAMSVDTDTIKIPPNWFPMPMIFDSFKYVLDNTPIVQWYINSVYTSLIVVVVVLFITMAGAYALSQLEFPFKKTIFIIFLAGFMIPGATNIVPLFMMMNQVNMVNTNWGLILPQLVSPIALIIYKQFFDQMPQELTDAARIDGAGEIRILFRIFLPLNWGITWALAIVLFIWTWNNFFWPFIVINSTPKMTIPVGITQVNSWYGIAYGRIMASAVLAALPMALIYIIFQKKVSEGVAMTAGIKG
jgi:multiple sugar transport system permease protein